MTDLPILKYLLLGSEIDLILDRNASVNVRFADVA